MPVILEVCCGSVEDAIAAARGGADRIELNSALELGGLTPSLGELLVTVEHVHVPVVAMVRPRAAGFCYGRYEFEAMCCDACSLVDAGASGICFGILTEDGHVDEKRCDTLMRMVRRVDADCEFVFSRAIDVVPDRDRAIDSLALLGFDRVLTSGGAPSALEGAVAIRRMAKKADGRLSVMAGAGVAPDNVAELVEATGVAEVHGSFSRLKRDSSCSSAPELSFGTTADSCAYRACDERVVMAALVALGRGAEVDEMVATGV